MPQSLINVPQAGDGPLHFSPNAVLQRPELASFVLVVINTWSTADSSLLQILAHCYRADPEMASALLRVVKNRETIDGLITAALIHTLPDDRVLIEVSMQAVKKLRRTRDEFAHHMWGVTPALEDALLLTDPKHFAFRATEVAAGKKETVVWDRASIYVYRLKELDDAVVEAKDGMMIIDWLAGLVHRPHGREGEQRRKLLRSRPSIAAGLKRREQVGD